jgi:hypothetical protein
MNFSFLSLSARLHYLGESCAANTRHVRPLKHEKVQRCPLAGTDTDVFTSHGENPAPAAAGGKRLVAEVGN